MLAIDRKKKILDYLVAEGSCSISNLSQLVNVSEMTVRRDLNDLEMEGLVKRTHGGALYIRDKEPAFEEKNEKMQHIKRKLARYATNKFVNHDEMIALEAGTTVTMMSQYLKKHRNLTVLTNGLETLNKLKVLVPTSTVISCGGMLRDISNTFVGPLAEGFFKEFHPSVAFFSASGFTAEQGFTDPNLMEGQVKRAIGRTAKKSVMILDSSKFGYCSSFTTFSIKDIHILITDEGIPQENLELFRTNNIDVHVVPTD